MAFDVEKELKIYMYLSLIVLIVYGLWFFIFYESYYALMTPPFFSPIALRVIGGIYIGWAIAIIRLLKHLDNWEMIENWVIMGVVSTGLTIIAEIIGVIVYNTPLGTALITIILSLFFTILGIHIIIQKRK